MTDLARLPPAVRALVAAGRASLGNAPGPPPALTDAEQAELADFAVHHGMVSWLPDARAMASPTSPAPGATDAALLQRHLARVVYGIRDLAEATAILRANGVAAVALRGPAFAAWLYGDPTARRFVDLDLLVPKSQRLDAARMLGSIGYRLPIPPACARAVDETLGAWPFTRNGSEIDLHWRAAGRRFWSVLTTDAILRDRIIVRIGVAEIEAPAPTHAAVLALMHAAKHLWYSLELTLSIAHLTRRSDVEWEAVRALATRAGALRPAAAGLRLAAELFGTTVPAPFMRDVHAPVIERLCACAAETLALRPFAVPDHRIDRQTHRLAFDRAVDRFTYDVRRLVEPTYADFGWVVLPSPLVSLYPMVRLVRLGGMAAGLWKG